VSFGAVVASTVPATEKRLDHQRIRPVIPVVEDQYVISFGHTGYSYPSAQTLTGTNIASAFVHCPPICIQPLGNLKVVFWHASQTTASSFEYTFGFIER
jgi:hypothetical protein